MNPSITISTGARLHFGPLSYRPEVGRHFGGVGVMIDEPGFRLSLRRAECDAVVGEQTASERVRQFLDRYRESCLQELQPPPCEIHVDQAMPSHHGLGSGTQMGLAVARGLATLSGEETVTIAELARRVGRGRRSAVGIHGFAEGGLIVDAGQRSDEQVGSLCCRLTIPDEWQVLLITPREGAAGLSGVREERAFDDLGAMPQQLTDRLCRIVLTELLPAAGEHELEHFGEALDEYGRLVGEFFAPVQGGTFGHPLTDALIAELRRLGVSGAGQTSWGPTVFAFVPDVESGQHICAALSETTAVDVVRSRPRNVGARVESSSRLSRR